MSRYRVIVHYYVKPGMEEKLKAFLEENLLKAAIELGCEDAEYLRDENDPSHFIGTGLWESISVCLDFHSQWEGLREEVLKMCTKEPVREFYAIDKHYDTKSIRAA